MSGNAARLYDEDFVRWTEEQAAALRDAAGLAHQPAARLGEPRRGDRQLGPVAEDMSSQQLMVILEHLLNSNTPRQSILESVG